MERYTRNNHLNLFLPLSSFNSLDRIYLGRIFLEIYYFPFFLTIFLIRSSCSVSSSSSFFFFFFFHKKGCFSLEFINSDGLAYQRLNWLDIGESYYIWCSILIQVSRCPALACCNFESRLWNEAPPLFTRTFFSLYSNKASRLSLVETALRCDYFISQVYRCLFLVYSLQGYN